MTLFIPLPTSLDKAAIDKSIADALTKDQAEFVASIVAPNTWYNFPDTGGRAIAGFTFLDSTGDEIELDTRINGGSRQYMSAIALSDLQILLEY
jgi:hypothetical protein